ncbi:protein tfg [Anaeramoeba ignava]|uniref:Protein tfg n=1 Tax=Anaeramoeba ignava TaxID=1746090 RepID=A0A9Q0LRR8_ANAIG|nr:protein tfg [Anaeramoeba ignava]|eukprot:Anaeramoba_ignava/c15096_g1_i1.p1 GENE.c15096_g1_i1~~c15096_g1_i1.p1  ORF type:complete len:453 (+),score=155.77 c15096_g1_i1:42-1400(+)
MQSNNKITIKCCLGEDIRRFYLPKEAEYETLLLNLQQIYKIDFSKSSNFQIQYIDEEEDWITITSTHELYTAIQLISNNTPPVLKLQIFLKEDEDEINDNEDEYEMNDNDNEDEINDNDNKDETNSNQGFSFPFFPGYFFFQNLLGKDFQVIITNVLEIIKDKSIFDWFKKSKCEIASIFCQLVHSGAQGVETFKQGINELIKDFEFSLPETKKRITEIVNQIANHAGSLNMFLHQNLCAKMFQGCPNQDSELSNQSTDQQAQNGNFFGFGFGRNFGFNNKGFGKGRNQCFGARRGMFRGRRSHFRGRNRQHNFRNFFQPNSNQFRGNFYRNQSPFGFHFGQMNPYFPFPFQFQNVDQQNFQDDSQNDFDTQNFQQDELTNQMNEKLGLNDNQVDDFNSQKDDQIFPYMQQLEDLKEMGFPDSEEIRRLLIKHEGQISFVLNSLLSNSAKFF